MHVPAHEHTWLHNNLPYFLCKLKSPFSLLISLSPQHACAHASIASRYTHIACFPPEDSQHANPAWKLEGRRKGGVSFASTGHIPWQRHPDCEPVRLDMCGTLTQWQRSYRGSGPMKKGALASLPSLTRHMLTSVKESPKDTEQPCVCVLHIAVSLVGPCGFSPGILTRHSHDKQSQKRTKESDITSFFFLNERAQKKCMSYLTYL